MKREHILIAVIKPVATLPAALSFMLFCSLMLLFMESLPEAAAQEQAQAKVEAEAKDEEQKNSAAEPRAQEAEIGTDAAGSEQKDSLESEMSPETGVECSSGGSDENASDDSAKLSEKELLKLRREANAYLQHRSYDEALSHCNKILESYPDDLPALAIRGSTFLAGRKFKEAISDLSRVLAQQNTAAQAALFGLRAEAFLLTDQYENSIRDSNKAIEFDPKNQQYYMIRGVAFYRNKNYEKSLDDYNKAIAIDPHGHNLAVFLSLRSDTYTALGRAADALKDLNKVLKLKPQDPAAWMNRASYYALQKDWQKAALDLDQVINWAPMGKLSNDALILRAEARRKSGNYKDAIDDYNTLLIAFPEEPKYLSGRAKARFEIKEDLEKALIDVNKCLTVSPDDKDYLELKEKIVAAIKLSK